MKLRFSYQDERGGIDFGEVEIDAEGWARPVGAAPVTASRTVELGAEGGEPTGLPWWAALTIEVIE